jgi:hypothetical protein
MLLAINRVRWTVRYFYSYMSSCLLIIVYVYESHRGELWIGFSARDVSQRCYGWNRYACELVLKVCGFRDSVETEKILISLNGVNIYCKNN